MAASQPASYAVRKEIKCSWDFKILRELVRDPTQKSEKQAVLNSCSNRNQSGSISESPVQCRVWPK